MHIREMSVNELRAFAHRINDILNPNPDIPFDAVRIEAEVLLMKRYLVRAVSFVCSVADDATKYTKIRELLLDFDATYSWRSIVAAEALRLQNERR